MVFYGHKVRAFYLFSGPHPRARHRTINKDTVYSKCIWYNFLYFCLELRSFPCFLFKVTCIFFSQGLKVLYRAVYNISFPKCIYN